MFFYIEVYVVALGPSVYLFQTREPMSELPPLLNPPPPPDVVYHLEMTKIDCHEVARVHRALLHACVPLI